MGDPQTQPAGQPAETPPHTDSDGTTRDTQTVGSEDVGSVEDVLNPTGDAGTIDDPANVEHVGDAGTGDSAQAEQTPDNVEPASPARQAELLNDRTLANLMNQVKATNIVDQVKKAGAAILDELLTMKRPLQLTDDEKGIAQRASEQIAAGAIFSIGQPPEVQQRIKVQVERAQATLLNLAVGEAVEAKAAARDAIYRVVQRLVREALAIVFVAL